MASNTNLNAVRRDIYLGIKEQSREVTGFIQAVNTSTGAEVASKHDVVKIPYGTAGKMIDTPVGFAFPDAADSDVGSLQMTLDFSKTVPIDWDGEQEKVIINAGIETTVLGMQFADAIRQITNAIEKTVADEIVKHSSRAYGTAGITPFADGSKMTDMAQMKGILDKNGAPRTNRTIVLSSEAETSLLSNQTNFIKVNEAGSDQMIRQGIIMPTYGFNVRSSFGIEEFQASTFSGATVNGTADVGATEIAITGATGSLKAGDVVTFGDAKEKYVVEDYSATKITINKGLIKPVAKNAAIAVGGNYTPSFAMTKGAVALAVRPPKAPKDGDMMERAYVTDPISGITYEIARVKGQRIIQYQVSALWGVKVVNPEHVATLLG